MMKSNEVQPKITVITVCWNDPLGLAKTIKSLSEQDCSDYEYIVIDGGSSSESIDILKENSSYINYWLSEADAGVYHGMNKGVALAKGTWLLFMNAGDVFCSKESLSSAASMISDSADVIYSDWVYQRSGRLVKADLEKLNVRHQSVMYRRSLHATYGAYVVGKNVSISDYIFFLSITSSKWVYCLTPISKCDEQGLSAKPSHFYQRIASEIIFGKRSRLNAAIILLIYPIYRFLKRTILRRY